MVNKGFIFSSPFFSQISILNFSGLIFWVLSLLPLSIVVSPDSPWKPFLDHFALGSFLSSRKATNASWDTLLCFLSWKKAKAYSTLFLRSAAQPTNLSPFSTHTEQAARFPNSSEELSPKFSSLSCKRPDVKPIPMLKSSHDISKQVTTIIVRFLACSETDTEHRKIQGSKKPNSLAAAVHESRMNSEGQ